MVEEAIGWLAEPAVGELPHTDLEQQLQQRSREVFRQLLQDHLDRRACREEQAAARQAPVVPVCGSDGMLRRYVESGHERGLVTVFGRVSVTRLAYRAKGVANLCPADAVLNLPADLHSHGLARLAAVEAARGSFAAARAAIERATGVRIGVRQVRRLAGSAALDVPAFYARRQGAPAKAGDALALTVDGKGIVMRPDSLRTQTAKAAATAERKLATRLSKGEKANRKRMAEVGCVYDFTPTVRTPADVISAPGRRRARAPGPKAAGKWLHASVARPAGQVIADVFDEAARRDPGHERDWVALVDGNNHQIDAITAEAATRGVTVTIIVDFVHVIEYLWQAAWCLHAEADPAAETWIAQQATNILAGKAGYVAALIRRTATKIGLSGDKRHRADDAASYLLAKRPYLDYPTALATGWPIATGVIEGACRHLIADRMDITGARWGLAGAEAILQLRAVAANGDFDDYWAFHLRQQHQRVHASRYADTDTIR
jgi:antitoxin component of MazEF toxin-antitoxin module